jgi:hypothetical protein
MEMTTKIAKIMEKSPFELTKEDLEILKAFAKRPKGERKAIAKEIEKDELDRALGGSDGLE